VPGRDQGRAELGLAYTTDDDTTDDIDDTVGLDAFDLVEFTDEELTELALEADPFDPFDPDVEPIDPLRRR
jgi:hypothetical protein